MEELSTSKKIAHFQKHRHEYDFPYERVMKHNETRRVFKEYLSKTHNVEPLLFLEDIHQYHLEIIKLHGASGHSDHLNLQGEAANQRTKLLVAQFENLSRTIVKKYISSDAPHQINLGGEEKRALYARVKAILLYGSRSPSQSQLQHHQPLSARHNNRDAPSTTSTSSTPSPLTTSQAGSHSTFTSTATTEPPSPKSPTLDSSSPLSTFFSDLQKAQYQVFDPIENSLNCVLKQDSYPRFMRSGIWLDFVDQCCHNEQRFVEVIERTCVYHDERFVSFTLDDFMRPMITEEDMEFAIQVCSDQSHWKPLHNPYNTGLNPADQMEVYQSKKRFIFSSKEQAKNLHRGDMHTKKWTEGLLRLKTPIKFTFYIPHHYEHVVGAFQSEKLRQGNKDFKYRVNDVIGTSSENKLAYVSQMMEFTMPNPFVNREICTLVSSRRTMVDGKEACVCISRPFNDLQVEKLAPDNQRCYMLQCWTLVRIHKTLTRVTMVLFMEFGGMLSMFTKQMYRQQIQLTHKYRINILETLWEMQKEEFKKPENTLSLLEVYEQNNAIRKQRTSIYFEDTSEYSDDTLSSGF